MACLTTSRWLVSACGLALVAGLSLIGQVAASDGPELTDLQSTSLPSFSLEFSALGGELGASPSLVEPGNTSDDLLAFLDRLSPDDQILDSQNLDGQRLGGSDVLVYLAARTAPQSSDPQSLFQDATLNLIFRDHQTETTEVLALAQCMSLDFETIDPIVRDQKALCDGQSFTYGIGDDGLFVQRDEEVVLSLPLEPGTYALNGMPFMIPASE